MKKVFSLCLICFLAVSAMAQRAAVMEFKAGSGISQADVDGISGIFTTYLPSNTFPVLSSIFYIFLSSSCANQKNVVILQPQTKSLQTYR